MVSILDKMTAYLKEALNVQAQVRELGSLGWLPLFLTQMYSLHELEFMDKVFALMQPREPGEATPSVIRRHMEILGEKTGQRVIYLSEAINRFDRKRMVEYHIPFIIPAKQMYLPDLGIDFREVFGKSQPLKEKFKPSAQVTLIRAILTKDYSEHSVSEIANATGYALMTITRVFDDLAGLDLGEVFEQGKERILRWKATGKTLWDLAHRYMISPVRRRVWVLGDLDTSGFIKAGISALAEYTMLADDKNPTYAMSAEQYTLMKQREKCIEIPHSEPGCIRIEEWKYSPELLSRHNIVDKLSLFLSLKDEKDTRTLGEIEKLMENIEW